MSKNELGTAMRLAGENLLNALNPEDNYLPYWELTIREDYGAEFLAWWPQHNLGRWMDAMMRLEEATGFQIPAEMEAAMTQNVMRFFDNPDCLCFQPLDYAEKPFSLEVHSLREGMLALHALIKYRRNPWALEMAHKMTCSVDRLLDDDMNWKIDQFDYFKTAHPEVFPRHFDGAGSHGRFCEALLWYYQQSQDADALKLATRIMEYHYAHTTCPEGSVCMDSKPDHMHSFMNTLLAMVLYGRITAQRRFIDRAARVMETYVMKTIKESGFTSHDMFTDTMGETSSPGDALQLALWLVEEGYTQFADFAERILRARMLPSQLTQAHPLVPSGADGSDRYRALTERSLGGWCMHMYPHGGKKNTTDVTASCLHSVIDAYRHIVLKRPDGLIVLLHFDYEDERVSVRSERDGAARVTVSVRERTPVMVRIPGFAPAESVSVRVNGEERAVEMAGLYACIGTLEPGDIAEIGYALPEREIQETTDGTEYTLRWKGDDVTGISPNVAFYPYYPDMGN